MKILKTENQKPKEFILDSSSSDRCASYGQIQMACMDLSKNENLKQGILKRLLNPLVYDFELINSGVSWKDSIRKDFELSNRGDREEQLRAELEELNESIGGGIETSSIIKRLKELEVVYVVYHPGAGHINMTSDDILRYVENPNAFIASKCFVTEGQYLAWLEHFDNPVCRHKNEQGHVCALQIDKVSIPSEFDQGVDDRCERHQANDV